MNCDMGNDPELVEYQNEDGSIWWLDAQQILLRSLGKDLIEQGNRAWPIDLERSNEVVERVGALVLPALNISDPIFFRVTETPSVFRADVELMMLFLGNSAMDFRTNALKYWNGNDEFNDSQLVAMAANGSLDFLPRIMEFTMRDLTLESFQHAIVLGAYATQTAQEISDWVPPEKTGEGAHSTPKPAPQPYGVSHEGAETLVRDWMLYLGMPSSEVTRLTGDGGIDVTSVSYVAQVKNYKDFVGVQAIREILGVAVAEEKKPLFFTSGSYTSEALTFAKKAKVPLFTYDATAGTLERVNKAAEKIFLKKNNVSDDEIGQTVAENLRVYRFSVWILLGTNGTNSRLLNFLFPGKDVEISNIKRDIASTQISIEAMRDSWARDDESQSLLSDHLIRLAEARDQANGFINVNLQIEQLVSTAGSENAAD
jgi:hypothetical protein